MRFGLNGSSLSKEEVGQTQINFIIEIYFNCKFTMNQKTKLFQLRISTDIKSL